MPLTVSSIPKDLLWKAREQARLLRAQQTPEQARQLNVYRAFPDWDSYDLPVQHRLREEFTRELDRLDKVGDVFFSPPEALPESKLTSLAQQFTAQATSTAQAPAGLEAQARRMGEAIAAEIHPSLKVATALVPGAGRPTVAVRIETAHGQPFAEPFEVSVSGAGEGREVLINGRTLPLMVREQPGAFLREVGQKMAQYEATHRGLWSSRPEAVVAGLGRVLDRLMGLSPYVPADEAKQPWARERDLRTRFMGQATQAALDPGTGQPTGEPAKDVPFDPYLPGVFFGHPMEGPAVPGYVRRQKPGKSSAGETLASQFQAYTFAAAPGQAEIGPGEVRTTLGKGAHKRIQQLGLQRQVVPIGGLVFQSPFAHRYTDLESAPINPQTGAYDFAKARTLTVPGGTYVKANVVFQAAMPAGQGLLFGWEEFFAPKHKRLRAPRGGELRSYIQRGEHEGREGWVERDLSGRFLGFAEELERGDRGYVVGRYADEAGELQPLELPVQDAVRLRNLDVTPTTYRGQDALAARWESIFSPRHGQIKMETGGKAVMGLGAFLPLYLPEAISSKVNAMLPFYKTELASANWELWGARQIDDIRRAGGLETELGQRFLETIGRGSHLARALEAYLSPVPENAKQRRQIVMTPEILDELGEAYGQAHTQQVGLAEHAGGLNWLVAKAFQKAGFRSLGEAFMVPYMYSETALGFTDIHAGKRRFLRDDAFTLGVAETLGLNSPEEIEQAVSHPVARAYRHLYTAVGMNAGQVSSSLQPVALDWDQVVRAVKAQGKPLTPQNLMNAMAEMEEYGWNPIRLDVDDSYYDAATDTSVDRAKPYVVASARAWQHFLSTNVEGQASGIGYRLFNLMRAVGTGAGAGRPARLLDRFDAQLREMLASPEVRRNVYGGSRGAMPVALGSLFAPLNRVAMGDPMLRRFLGEDELAEGRVELSRFPFSNALSYMGNRLGVTTDASLELKLGRAAAVNPIFGVLVSMDFDGELMRIRQLAKTQRISTDDALLYRMAERLKGLGGEVDGVPVGEIAIGTPDAPDRDALVRVVLGTASDYNEAYKWIEEMRATAGVPGVRDWLAAGRAALGQLSLGPLAEQYYENLRAQQRMSVYNRINREGEMIARPEERQALNDFEDVVYQRAQDKAGFSPSFARYYDLLNRLRFVGASGVTFGLLQTGQYRRGRTGQMENVPDSYMWSHRGEGGGTAKRVERGMKDLVDDVVSVFFGEDSMFDKVSAEKRVAMLTNDSAEQAGLLETLRAGGGVQDLTDVLLGEAGQTNPLGRVGHLLAKGGLAFRLLEPGATRRSFKGLDPAMARTELAILFDASGPDVDAMRQRGEWIKRINDLLGKHERIAPDEAMRTVQAGRIFGGGFRSMFDRLARSFGLPDIDETSLGLPTHDIPAARNGSGEFPAMISPMESQLLKRLRNLPATEFAMRVNQLFGDNLDQPSGASVGRGAIPSYAQGDDRRRFDVTGSKFNWGRGNFLYEVLQQSLFGSARPEGEDIASLPEHLLPGWQLALGSLIHALPGGARTLGAQGMEAMPLTERTRQARAAIQANLEQQYGGPVLMLPEEEFHLNYRSKSGAEPIGIGGHLDLPVVYRDPSGQGVAMSIVDAKWSRSDYYAAGRSMQNPFYGAAFPGSKDYRENPDVLRFLAANVPGVTDPRPRQVTTQYAQPTEAMHARVNKAFADSRIWEDYFFGGRLPQGMTMEGRIQELLEGQHPQYNALMDLLQETAVDLFSNPALRTAPEVPPPLSSMGQQIEATHTARRAAEGLMGRVSGPGGISAARAFTVVAEKTLGAVGKPGMDKALAEAFDEIQAEQDAQDATAGRAAGQGRRGRDAPRPSRSSNGNTGDNNGGNNGNNANPPPAALPGDDNFFKRAGGFFAQAILDSDVFQRMTRSLDRATENSEKLYHMLPKPAGTAVRQMMAAKDVATRVTPLEQLAANVLETAEAKTQGALPDLPADVSLPAFGEQFRQTMWNIRNDSPMAVQHQGGFPVHATRAVIGGLRSLRGLVKDPSRVATIDDTIARLTAMQKNLVTGAYGRTIPGVARPALPGQDSSVLIGWQALAEEKGLSPVAPQQMLGQNLSAEQVTNVLRLAAMQGGLPGKVPAELSTLVGTMEQLRGIEKEYEAQGLDQLDPATGQPSGKWQDLQAHKGRLEQRLHDSTSRFLRGPNKAVSADTLDLWERVEGIQPGSFKPGDVWDMLTARELSPEVTTQIMEEAARKGGHRLRTTSQFANLMGRVADLGDAHRNAPNPNDRRRYGDLLARIQPEFLGMADQALAGTLGVEPKAPPNLAWLKYERLAYQKNLQGSDLPGVFAAGGDRGLAAELVRKQALREGKEVTIPAGFNALLGDVERLYEAERALTAVGRNVPGDPDWDQVQAAKAEWEPLIGPMAQDVWSKARVPGAPGAGGTGGGPRAAKAPDMAYLPYLGQARQQALTGASVWGAATAGVDPTRLQALMRTQRLQSANQEIVFPSSFTGALGTVHELTEDTARLQTIQNPTQQQQADLQAARAELAQWQSGITSTAQDLLAGTQGAPRGRTGAGPKGILPMTADQAAVASEALAKLNDAIKQTGVVAKDTEGLWGRVMGTKEGRLHALAEQAEGYQKAYDRLRQIETRVQRRGLTGDAADAFRGRELLEAQDDIRQADAVRPRSRARLAGERLLFNAYDLWYAGLIGRMTWDPFSTAGQEYLRHGMGTLEGLAGMGVVGQGPAFVGQRNALAPMRESLGAQALAMENVLVGAGGVLDSPLGAAAMIGLPAIGLAGFGQHIAKSILGMSGVSALGLFPLTAAVMGGLYMEGASRNESAQMARMRLAARGDRGVPSFEEWTGAAGYAWDFFVKAPLTDLTWSDIGAERQRYMDWALEADRAARGGFYLGEFQRASPGAATTYVQNLARLPQITGQLPYMEAADREKLIGRYAWMYPDRALDTVDWANLATQQMAGRDPGQIALRMLQAQGLPVNPRSFDFWQARDVAADPKRAGTAEEMVLNLYGAQAGAISISAQRVGIARGETIGHEELPAIQPLAQQAMEFSRAMSDRVSAWSPELAQSRYWTKSFFGKMQPKVFLPEEESRESWLESVAAARGQRAFLLGRDGQRAYQQIMTGQVSALADQFQGQLASQAIGTGAQAYSLTGDSAFGERITDLFNRASPDLRAMMQAVAGGDPYAISRQAYQSGDPWKDKYITREPFSGFPIYQTGESFTLSRTVGGVGRVGLGIAGRTLDRLMAQGKQGLAEALTGTQILPTPGGGYTISETPIPVGQLGNLTGIVMPRGGLIGLQQYMADLSYAGQMASLGSSQRSLQLSHAFTTGIGLGDYGQTLQGVPLSKYEGASLAKPGGEWWFQDQFRALQRKEAMAGFGLQGQSLALQGAQFMENWNFNRNQAMLQRGWQQEDSAFQARQMAQSRGWQREDWAFETGQRELQFGWRMEDYDRNLRFATGRQRREMQIARERDVEMNNIATGREGTMRSRQETVWQQEDERFDVQQKRAEELFDLQMERFDLEKRQFDERQAIQLAQHGQQVAFFNERDQLEKDYQDLQRTQWELAFQEQERALGAQAGIAEAVKDAQDQMTDLVNNQNALEQAQKTYQTTSLEFYKAMADMLWRIANQYDPEHDLPYPMITWEFTGVGKGQYEPPRHWGDDYTYYSRTSLTVAENGPEHVRVTPSGFQPRAEPNGPSAEAIVEALRGITLVAVLDGKEISAALDVRSGNRLYLQSRR